MQETLFDMTKENNDEKYDTIYKTKDYDKFKFIKGNRKLQKTKYSQLVQSMREEQLIIPIIVNEKFEVVDGQHRANCCKELGLPVYYIINRGYGIDQVKRANLVSSNWTKEDYLGLHISNGLEVYEQFDEIRRDYGINITDLIKIYSNVQNKNMENLAKDFDNGKLTNDGIDLALQFLEAWNDFSFFRYYKKKQFIAAFLNLYFDKRYDHSKMLNKLETRGRILLEINVNLNKQEYLSKLTNGIYSFGASKNNIYYDTNTKRFYE